MGYEAKLNLKQVSSLGLNAALIQAIKLLPMARQDLVEVIRQELEENPMLEDVAVEADDYTPADGEDAPSPADADSMTDGAELYDVNWAEYFPEDWEWKGLPSETYEERFAFENTIRTPPSLQEHLLLQLRAATNDAAERLVGAFLIGNIDEEGYLHCDLEEIIVATKTDHGVVERALALIHSFDPAGVGARDLRDCLLIQLRALGLTGSLLDTIVSDCLPRIQPRMHVHTTDVAREIAKSLSLSTAEVTRALRLLRTLDPKPGLRFASEVSEAIVPDVIIRKVGHDYQILLNDEGIPKLRISTLYRRLLRDGQPEEKDYLRERLRSAVCLMRGIDQRRQTLLRVTTSIVKFQREFFEIGLAHLKPLVLKDVAEDIGMHESTVSRVTTKKYLDSERGLFELKYFFHSGLASYKGETLSSLTVKDRIKELVATENPGNPLTDQDLVESLANETIKIARRTVAKYRRELKLPPAKNRKRQRAV